MIDELTATQFNQSVMQTEKMVLIDFSAKWCAPCHLLQIMLEEWQSNHADEVEIYKVDVDQCPEIAIHYQVRNLPTLILFKSGKQVASHIGLIKDKDLMDLIRQSS